MIHLSLHTAPELWGFLTRPQVLKPAVENGGCKNTVIRVCTVCRRRNPFRAGSGTCVSIAPDPTPNPLGHIPAQINQLIDKAVLQVPGKPFLSLWL